MKKGKLYISKWDWKNKTIDESHRRAYELCFGKRPAEELYDLKKDPGQLINVAADEAYMKTLKALGGQLSAELAASGDPRHGTGKGFDFDAVPYLGGAPKHPDFGRRKSGRK